LGFKGDYFLGHGSSLDLVKLVLLLFTTCILTGVRAIRSITAQKMMTSKVKFHCESSLWKFFTAAVYEKRFRRVAQSGWPKINRKWKFIFGSESSLWKFLSNWPSLSYHSREISRQIRYFLYCHKMMKNSSRHTYWLSFVYSHALLEHPAFFRCQRHSKGIRDRLGHRETKARYYNQLLQGCAP
jgi:hypothetical protein